MTTAQAYEYARERYAAIGIDTEAAIAKVLSISPRTAETHKYNIFTKLHAESMVDLMKIAIRDGHVSL